MVGAGRGLRFCFTFLGAIVMWAVRVDVEGIGGGTRSLMRKSGSGCYLSPAGGSVGSVLCGRSGKARDWLCHRAATV